MSFLLEWIGIVCVGLGCLIVLALFVWGAAEACFKAVKVVFGSAWIFEAMRHYSKVTPNP
jgi:hypothetical protein